MPDDEPLLHQLGAFDPAEATRLVELLEQRDIAYEIETDQSALSGANDFSGLQFGVNPEGKVCADLGASTGGFTDCLLQRGAAKVYAIDVGYGQLAWSLRQDPRVVVMERTNARLLTSLPDPAELVVGDLSFTALAPMLPAIRAICAPGALLVLLVKPQFEVRRDQVKKGGLVTDPNARAGAVTGVLAEAQAEGFEPLGSIESPVTGLKAGNIEHLIGLRAPGGRSG